MTKLFTRKLSAVTHIPGEDDVDPEMLECTPGKTNTSEDYRDSNQESRYGEHVEGGVTGSVHVAVNFVDPHSQEWPEFVQKLKLLPTGAELRTHDGVILIKQEDGTFADEDLVFMLDELDGPGMPPLAITKEAGRDKTYVGQHREDGSYILEEVDATKAEEMADGITKGPDGSKAEVIKAPDGEAARGKIYESMKDKGLEPAASNKTVSPTASLKSGSAVIKSGDRYFRLDRGRGITAFVPEQSRATKFGSERDAGTWLSSEAVAGAIHRDAAWGYSADAPRVVTIKSK